jgi:ABC-type transporter Mla maintaining outer membrane lipid asymmetry ATPase subunit MlaF
MLNSSLLNAGVKKCISNTTVLSMNPSILVFNEPSIGLDPRTIVMDEGQVVADYIVSVGTLNNFGIAIHIRKVGICSL